MYSAKPLSRLTFSGFSRASGAERARRGPRCRGKGLPTAPGTPRFPRRGQRLRLDYRTGSGFERSAGSSGRHHATFGPTQSLDAVHARGRRPRGVETPGSVRQPRPGLVGRAAAAKRGHRGTDPPPAPPARRLQTGRIRPSPNPSLGRRGDWFLGAVTHGSRHGLLSNAPGGAVTPVQSPGATGTAGGDGAGSAKGAGGPGTGNSITNQQAGGNGGDDQERLALYG